MILPIMLCAIEYQPAVMALYCKRLFHYVTV